MSETTLNEIGIEPKGVDLEPKSIVIDQIIKDCKNDLDKFPSNGANYFSFPELPDYIKTDIENLSQQEIDDFIWKLAKTDMKKEYKEKYGHRTFGYFMTNLVSRKREFVGKAIEKPFMQLLEDSYNQPENKLTINNILKLGGISSYLPEDKQTNFNDEFLVEYHTKFQSTHLDYDLISVLPYEMCGAEKDITLDLFKEGINNNEIVENVDNFLLIIDKECLLPFEALYEKEKTNEELDSLSTITALSLVTEAMNDKQIDSQKLLSLSDSISDYLPRCLYLKLSDSQLENLSPNLKNMIDNKPLTESDAEIIMRQIILRNSKIDTSSFIYKKLQTVDLSHTNLGVCISIALHMNNGEWDQVNPLLRNIIEKSYLNKKLEGSDICDILSTTVELNCKIPSFFDVLLRKPENESELVKYAFVFNSDKPPNLYGGYQAENKNIDGRILSEGFSIYPDYIQELYKDVFSKNIIQKNEIVNKIFDLVIPEFSLDNNFYKKINSTKIDFSENDYKSYNFLSEDIIDLLKNIDSQQLEDRLNKCKYKDGKINIWTKNYYEKIDIPIENLLHPKIIDNITSEIFPKWQIERSSFNYTNVLDLIITDKTLENFSENDRNFLKFTKKYPEAGKILFEYKDKYFTKDVKSIEELITPNLILDVMQTSPLNTKTLTNIYIDINKENLDFNFLKKVVNYKVFPAEKAMVYIKGIKEYDNVYQKLYEQSKGQEWTDTIPDVDNYWENNSMLLVNLLETGIDNIDFKTFRSLNNNPNIVEIFNDNSIKIEDLSILSKQININLQNFSYINLNSISLLKNYSLSEKSKEQLFFRRLLSEQPRSFNNAVYTVLKNRDIDIGDNQLQEQILSVISKVGNISPMVLKGYINENDPIKKEEFILKIKNIRERFLINEPIKNTLSEFGYGNEVLAELITLSFPGTNLDNVKSLIYQLDDRCEDLKDFKIDNNGYSPDIEQKTKVSVLKDGEEINLDLLKNLKEMFPRSLNEKIRSEYKDKLTESLIMVLKRRGAFNLDDLKENVPAILSIMYDEEPVQEFRKTIFDFSQPENVTTFLARVTELLGIYFKDNFENKLLENLENNNDLSTKLKSYITPQFIDQVTKNMSKIKNSQENDNFQKITTNMAKNIEEGNTINNQDMSKLVTILLENRIFTGEKGLRTQIKKEYKKFNFMTTDKTMTTDETPSFKGYVSKNVASFFAKTSAGICTAQDTNLFKRKDHLHVNLVNNDSIVGNIQGYIIEYQGQKALLFRGFNPSSTYVNPNNADMISEGMINIVKKFASDNFISNVFVTEQTGWHSLTNRIGEGVLKYFQKNYLLEKNEVEFSFPVTESQNITKMYKIT